MQTLLASLKHRTTRPDVAPRMFAIVAPPAGQTGVALPVSLILLIVVTLIALAALSGTTAQQKMTANFYDRQISFQGAEAGVAAAAATLQAGSATNIRNCGPGGSTCLANPFKDSNLPAASIITVTSSQFQIGGNAAAQPQYVIENMGTYADPNSDTGYNQTANAAQYGAQGNSTTSIFYRITARSGDPSQTEMSDRAVVYLQALYSQ